MEKEGGEEEKEEEAEKEEGGEGEGRGGWAVGKQKEFGASEMSDMSWVSVSSSSLSSSSSCSFCWAIPLCCSFCSIAFFGEGNWKER